MTIHLTNKGGTLNLIGLVYSMLTLMSSGAEKDLEVHDSYINLRGSMPLGSLARTSVVCSAGGDPGFHGIFSI